MAGKTQAGMFLCNDSREKFTVRTGTIFARSHIPLRKWLLATYLMAASKKGMSALQLSRMLGLSYESTWFMCHRIREGMKPTGTAPIGGDNKVVEADETFIGGKAKNRAYKKKEPKKHAVMTLVARDGESRTFHVANVKAKTLRETIVKVASRKSYLATDELASYGLMKRAVFGTHHSISEAHLPRYLAEWDFKWNIRNITDGERAALALKGAEGKRLTYRQPREGAHA